MQSHVLSWVNAISMKYKMIHVQNDPYTVTTVVPHYDRSVFLLKECDTNHTLISQSAVELKALE